MKWVHPEFEAFNFKLDDCRVLFKGNFAETQVGRSKKLKKNVVVKYGHLQEYECFLGEIRALMVLDHPNVVKMVAFNDRRRVQSLYLEYHERGDLNQLLQQYPTGMKVETYFPLFSQLMDALEYVHGKGYAHLDVKPGNILIGNRGQAVLTDFNLSQPHSQNGSSVLFRSPPGTRGYLAPETMNDRFVSPFRVIRQMQMQKKGVEAIPLDIWASGVVLYYMVTGCVPWYRAFENDQNFVKWDLYWYRREIVPGLDMKNEPAWRMFDKLSFHFMGILLASEPCDRFESIVKVKAHRWFQETASSLFHLKKDSHEETVPQKSKSIFSKLVSDKNVPECFFRKCL